MVKLITLVTFIIGIGIGFVISYQTKEAPYPEELLLKAELQADELRKFTEEVEVKKFISGTYIIIFNIRKLGSLELVEIDSLIAIRKTENESIHYLRVFK